MLSKKTKYGLKALVYIAKQESKIIPISDISESESISKKFLENILLTLKQNGVLGSKQGKSGGYYLINKPSETKLSKVMRTLEGPIAMVPCVSLNFYEKCDDCPDEYLCAVHGLMEEVRDASLNVFNNKTLADLI
ncbi:RrF2 family transcriptional regulator [Aurantibacter sp.]|uniref:RrF2 family transcriptional regulator n=1 Tax=Aurantibacter sp. TaxID=2807103 RepID=UPI0035C878D3